MLDQKIVRWPLERFEQAEDALRFLGSHPRHRLVEQQDPRAGYQRKAELELPALAMRQRAGELIGAGAEPNGVELGAGAIPVIVAAGPLENTSARFSSTVKFGNTLVIW